MAGWSSRKSTPPPITGSSVTSDHEVDCPLCLEEMDSSDCRFKPCPCGYQICRFCWHRIREEGNERCPACRRIYTDEDIEFLSETISKFKKATIPPLPANNNAREAVAATLSTANPVGVVASRKHLVDIRVIQKNLVYVIGVSARIAHEHILKETEFFGQFGKILKIVVNRKNTGTPLPTEKTIIGNGATTTSGSAYVTYSKVEEAARAISYVDGSVFDGRILRATYGTTKYCSYFLRGVSCPNAGCMYLHEEGETLDSYTKEALSSGKLHLHSNLVNKTEGSQFCQFGTIMYHRPLPVPPPTSQIIVPPNVAGSNHSEGSQSRTITSSSRSPSQSRPSSPPMSTPNCIHQARIPPPPTSPPINLAEYEDEALLFLNRLARWNNPSEFDMEPPRSPKSKRGEEPTTDGSTGSFDPFSETNAALNKCPSLWGGGRLKNDQGSSLSYQHFDGINTTPGPLIAKGALPGFDWSNTHTSPQALWNDVTLPEPIVTFKKLISGTPNKPAPVGSPITLPASNRNVNQSGQLGKNQINNNSPWVNNQSRDTTRSFPITTNPFTEQQQYPIHGKFAIQSTGISGNNNNGGGGGGYLTAGVTWGAQPQSQSSSPLLPFRRGGGREGTLEFDNFNDKSDQSKRGESIYKAPAPMTATSLENLFGYYSKQNGMGEMMNCRKVVDANILEQQFFRDNQVNPTTIPIVNNETLFSDTTGPTPSPKFNEVAKLAPTIPPIQIIPVSNPLATSATFSSHLTPLSTNMTVASSNTNNTSIPTPSNILNSNASNNLNMALNSNNALATQGGSGGSVKKGGGGAGNIMMTGKKDNGVIKIVPLVEVNSNTKKEKKFTSSSLGSSTFTSPVSTLPSVVSTTTTSTSTITSTPSTKSTLTMIPPQNSLVAPQSEGFTRSNLFAVLAEVGGVDSSSSSSSDSESTEYQQRTGGPFKKNNTVASSKVDHSNITNPQSVNQTTIATNSITSAPSIITTAHPSLVVTTKKKKKKKNGIKTLTGENGKLEEEREGLVDDKTFSPPHPMIIKENPMPIISSQPDYQITWPDAANGFNRVRLPAFHLMNEAERAAWRRWLSEESKMAKQEEIELKSKVKDLHVEVCSWFKNLLTV